jgi:hypothetical protein
MGVAVDHALRSMGQNRLINRLRVDVHDGHVFLMFLLLTLLTQGPSLGLASGQWLP